VPPFLPLRFAKCRELRGDGRGGCGVAAAAPLLGGRGTLCGELLLPPRAPDALLPLRRTRLDLLDSGGGAEYSSAACIVV
jgi:hypothetical protein